MTLTKETLVRYFDELKVMEIKARDLYQSILPDLRDDHDRKILQGITNDEQRHADIVQEIMDLLQAE